MVRSCRFCTGTIQALFENEGMEHNINVSVGKVKRILKNLYFIQFLCPDVDLLLGRNILHQ
jgi:hypothetical protein